jgi:hypothetical protein
MPLEDRVNRKIAELAAALKRESPRGRAATITIDGPTASRDIQEIVSYENSREAVPAK